MTPDDFLEMDRNLFAARAEEVAFNLADLQIGRIVPPALDDLVAADERVAGQVQAVRDADTTPTGADALAALAGEVVAGKVKPETAIKRLNGAASLRTLPGNPRRSRVDLLAGHVETAARAAEDRPEWSPTSLRRSVVPEVRSRLQKVADDMLSTMNAAPAIVREKVGEVRDFSGYEIGYGQPGGMAGALDWIAPTGDLRAVDPDELKAVQRLQAAWSVLSPSSFDAFWWLGTGQAAQRDSMNEYVGAAGAAFDHFDPALLVVGGEAVDYVAAGLRLDYLVAAGIVTEFSVVADPFGDDVEEWRARVRRAEQFDLYINEKRHLRDINGAVLVRDQAHLQDMHARTETPRTGQVELFRRHLLGSGRVNG